MKLLMVLLTLIYLLPTVVAEELLVVVSEGSRVESLTKGEVVDLFMGRYVTFPNGDKARVFDLASKSKTKGQFYKLLVNRTEAQVNAYWARLLFSGRSVPPEEADSPEALITQIQQTDLAIGYISSQDLTEGLKVVYRFETF